MVWYNRAPEAMWVSIVLRSNPTVEKTGLDLASQVIEHRKFSRQTALLRVAAGPS